MKNNLWKNWLLLISGLAIMLLPWTGFPQEIKTPLTIFLGFLVVVSSFTMARPASTRSAAPFPPEEEFIEEDNDRSHAN